MNLKPKPWMKYALLGTALLVGMAAGLINAYWTHHGGIPPFGWFIDGLLSVIVAALVGVGMVFFRRTPEVFGDEFSATKKRYAAQMGMMCGLILFVLSIFAHYLLPGPYQALMQVFEDKADAFAWGHLAGGFIFYTGFALGWVMTWIKYR